MQAWLVRGLAADSDSQPEVNLKQSEDAGFQLALMAHLWPGSIIAMINALAYAVLGIPPVIFGMILTGNTGAMRAGGALLALSGVASAVGFVGLMH